jgi:hypothetical protein
VTSWDVVNEIVGDGVSSGMTALQCVQQKNVWPTVTSDGSGKTFATDLGFVRAAFKTALQYAPASARLAINDYNTGSANAAKTQCMFPILADIVANAGVPYNRLAVGFQSHVSASAGGFVGKADLESTFAKLAALGANAMITELDIKLSGTDSADERYQAAIWGDYLDACLYASNCFEFINWECVPNPHPSYASAAADTALLLARVTISRGSAPRVLAPSSTRTATRSRLRTRLRRVSSATRAARASSARPRSARVRAPSPRVSARPLLLPPAPSPLRPLPRRRPAPPAAALWRSTASVVARVRSLALILYLTHVLTLFGCCRLGRLHDLRIGLDMHRGQPILLSVHRLKGVLSVLFRSVCLLGIPYSGVSPSIFERHPL